jgi:hypothetical protein
MRKPDDRVEELRDNAHLLRAWKRWHREQLEQVLAGEHGAAVARIIKFLAHMGPQSASALVALVREFDWSQMDADVKFVVMHEINSTITKLREQRGLPPIDDALPHERATAFLIIRQLLDARGDTRRSGSGN